MRISQGWRLLALIPLLSTSLWSADPSIGTWKLNVRRSSFHPGPGFQSETRTYEEQKDGVKVTIRTVSRASSAGLKDSRFQP